MDFALDDATERFRQEVLDFLAAELTPELAETIYRSGVSHNEGFVRALAARGWTVPDWPRDGSEQPSEFGLWDVHVLNEELTRAEAPIYASATNEMVGRVIAAAGADWLKQEILPAVLNGEIAMALGLSEPEAGSDVAAVRTRARRDGDDWVIDGQKMYTTNGHVADYVFLLTRSNPDVPRHAGLTLFLLPTDLPGVETQAIFTLSGERTNILFLNDVKLADRWRIGEVDGGWRALLVALQDEHSAPFAPHLARIVHAAEVWADEESAAGRPLDDPDAQARLARAATSVEVAELLEARVTWMETQGEVPVAEGPMAKLFSTEAIVGCAEDLAELAGPDALRSKLDPTALVDGLIEHSLRYSLGTTIYGGASEIQRNIIAQYACKLPR